MFEIKSRQINMDFHLSGEIEGVGENFNVDSFAAQLKQSHINAVTVFAKCHHGWFYYSDTAFAKHPNLKKDLLPLMIAACDKVQVEPAIYVSAGFDEVLAEQHHDWVIIRKDGTTERATSFETPGYHLMCFNTDYVDVLCNQVDEVMRKFSPKEIFYDICYPKPCYCKKCTEDMIKEGIDISDDNAVWAFAGRVYDKFCERTTAAVRKHSKTCRIFYNAGHFYRGRRDLANKNTHFEIESLPTGGWGYEHFPLTVNYLEQFGKDYLGMTGRFNNSWGEFGGYKDKNALLYEVGMFMCFGAKCSVGDQINFDGTLDRHTYDIIGNAYNYVERYEDFVYPSEKTVEIGVWSYEASSGIYNPQIDSGIIKILLRGKYQFDFIDAESDLSKYKLIILPDAVELNGELKNSVDAFVANGGKVLISGKSAIKAGNFIYDVGARFVGKDNLSPSYLDCESITGVPAHNVIYADSYMVECTGKLLAKKYRPFMNREGRHFCSHEHWPENVKDFLPVITEGKDGVYVAFDIFKEFAVFAPCEVRRVLIKLIDSLLDNDNNIKTNLPLQAISTLRKQSQKRRYVLQALYGIPYSAGSSVCVIDDVPTAYGVEFDVRVEEKIASVKDKDGKEIPFTQVGNRVKFNVDKIYIHELVSLEY